MSVDVLWRSPAPYAESWRWQRERAAALGAGEAPETLLLVEHPPVYTLGRRSDPAHLLLAEDALRRLGAEVHCIDRGGDVTWHGPGQLVGYPILDLNRRGRDLHAYVHALEQVMIDVAARFGITGRRVKGMTGVWVGEDKLASIGIKLGRGWIAYHGFALNVSPDLSWFQHIVPCGLHGKGVTSLSRLMGRNVSVDAARRVTVEAFLRHFDVGGLDVTGNGAAPVAEAGLGVQSPRAGGESDHVGGLRAS